MTYIEIKNAVQEGKTVYWNNKGYSVFTKNGKLYTKFFTGKIMIVEPFFGSNQDYFISD